MASYRELRERISGLRMAVCGDLMLDVYRRGRVTHMSPEDPMVPVVRLEDQVESVGGAGFAALQAAALGASVYVFGVVGNDAPGRRLVRLLEDEGVDTRGVLVDPSRPTTTKTRLRTDHGHQSRWDRELRSPLWTDHAAALGELARAFMFDGLLLSDYGKGVLRGDPGAQVAAELRRHSATVVLDPKDRLRGLGPVDAVTPNRSEFIALGHGLDALASARRFREELGDGCQVIVTRGEDGCTRYAGGSGSAVHTPARTVWRVGSVTGAGDVFAAVLTATRAAGGLWDQCTTMANAAASKAVELDGTETVGIEEIRQAVPAVGELTWA